MCIDARHSAALKKDKRILIRARVCSQARRKANVKWSVNDQSSGYLIDCLRRSCSRSSGEVHRPYVWYVSVLQGVRNHWRGLCLLVIWGSGAWEQSFTVGCCECNVCCDCFGFCMTENDFEQLILCSACAMHTDESHVAVKIAGIPIDPWATAKKVCNDITRCGSANADTITRSRALVQNARAARLWLH